MCRDRPDCVDLAIRRRAFERALRGPVGADQMEQVQAMVRVGAGQVPGSASEDRAPRCARIEGRSAPSAHDVNEGQ